MRSSRSFPSRSLACVLGVAAAMLSCVGASAQQAADANTIRVWGYEGLSAQLMRWEEAYRKVHPEARFVNDLHGPAAVMAGLYNGVADVALMGREIWPVDTMAYRWVYQQLPFGVTVATMGLQGPGQTFTPVVMVNAKNPLASITESQLDAIYGSEHRAAAANVRTWGELGLKGDWANKSIHVYGYGAEDALGVFFRHDVLKMDFKPNAESHLLSDRENVKALAAKRIVEAVAADPYAIGYASEPNGAEAKVLALDGAVRPSVATLTTHEYPLTRSVWMYFKRVPDVPIDTKVGSFVRFVLSAEGQALVQPADELLPLTPELVQKQVHKLDSPMPKAADVEEPGL